MSSWWIIGFLIAERLFEMVVARRNRLRMLARGGREYFAGSYRQIVILHVAFFAALILESRPWRIPVDALTIFGLFTLAVTMALRYWCVIALGDHWNTRIIVVPGKEPIRKGPYRLMRHPNYVAVALEFVAVPLLLRAPLTLVVFTILNLGVLRRRITLEEQALGEK